MSSLEEKIEQENSKYEKLKNRYYALGVIFIVGGTIIGIIFSLNEQMSPLLGGLSIALYIGFGVSVLMKSVSIKQDKEKSVKQIEISNKLDKISKKSELYLKMMSMDSMGGFTFRIQNVKPIQEDDMFPEIK